MQATVLITGANRGLGLALVQRFLGAGWHVFAGCRQDPGALTTLACQALTRVPLDVADMASVRQAAALVAGSTPALDVLINNAAVYHDRGKEALEALDLTDGRLEQTMNVNAFGVLRVTQQFLPLLVRGRRKVIANISSEAGSIGMSVRANEYAYTMSKAALNMASRLMHNAFAGRGFHVLVIQPGWMRTAMGGMDADLDPADSAEGIYQLVLQPGAAQYVDHLGNPLPW